MIGLWDTTGSAVVKALAAERRTAGGVTSGLALTLIVITEEGEVRAAEAAATVAAAAHPCRLLIVVRDEVTHARSRLDAEVVVGGRLGPCEAVVMRMRGRLALHAESVVMPLLAPDVPVVTWWRCGPPDRIAYDPLGVVAERRITDTLQCDDPLLALRTRADDYAPGDTDLAWTRITPWRTLVASVFDASHTLPTTITIEASEKDPSALLMSGWLHSRLGVEPELLPVPGAHMQGLTMQMRDGGTVKIQRENGSALVQRTGLPDRRMPLADRSLGEDLAEELRRLDPDPTYAIALAAATGLNGFERRSPHRVHIWHDPALAERPDTANIAGSDDGATEHAGTGPSGAPEAEVSGSARVSGDVEAAGDTRAPADTSNTPQ
ncbi:glucose-6-phosphate dehydrogenase assembly protein OpcA [Planosporangium thailandense]|uniref:Glucose-6-phosphate dehydrogenase assembly protein OpcA n=1 Tax=Planosporangium thailandense TaxID=765197 RepID=A0ABX0XWJ7_9ACTN|nr:glucose-6-phosphate dehydrogenase assembly protein OpcA [Planosporangium thailandense]NJC70416.1 glucose-6-phosphate dehydrogenase assembly protein OpcA [Planosporangium thailandense]